MKERESWNASKKVARGQLIANAFEGKLKIAESGRGLRKINIGN